MSWSGLQWVQSCSMWWPQRLWLTETLRTMLFLMARFTGRYSGDQSLTPLDGLDRFRMAQIGHFEIDCVLIWSCLNHSNSLKTYWSCFLTNEKYFSGMENYLSQSLCVRVTRHSPRYSGSEQTTTTWRNWSLIPHCLLSLTTCLSLNSSINNFYCLLQSYYDPHLYQVSSVWLANGCSSSSMVIPGNK